MLAATNATRQARLQRNGQIVAKLPGLTGLKPWVIMMRTDCN
jgi:hypothetical protein